VKLLLNEKNPLFDSLTGKLMDYPELTKIIYAILFRGENIGYNPDDRVIYIALMFGFIKIKNEIVTVANRIFETVLYNLFLSEEEIQNSEIYNASVRDRNQFIIGSHLNMRLILEKFVEHYNELYADSGEKFIEDEGLRKEFQGLVDDYYAHNMEVLEEYGNPVEKMAWAVKRFYNSSESTLHTKAEEQQYGEDLAEIFEKLRKNPSDKSVIWKQIQDTMLDYAANKEDGQEKRDQILSGAGDSFKRMEECWSFAG